MLKTTQDFITVVIIDMMQERIQQNKVGAVSLGRMIFTYILKSKFARCSMGSGESTRSVFDIPGVNVQPKILSSLEKLCICPWSATNIQYSLDVGKIRMFKQRFEFVLRKRSLPQLVDFREGQNVSYSTHIRSIALVVHRLSNGVWLRRKTGVVGD